MSKPRRVEVAPERIERWIEGFGQRHGDVTWSVSEPGYLLTAADGSWACVSGWHPPGRVPPHLLAWAEPPPKLALVLIRRGGYAVGRAQGDRLVTHKVGTSYVQSRTAAGGWSQQRYARRRSNQADALVVRAESHLGKLGPVGELSGLILGGDQGLCRALLDASGAAGLSALRRRELFDLPDPRLTVLEQALARGRCLHVVVSNAPAS